MSKANRRRRHRARAQAVDFKPITASPSGHEFAGYADANRRAVLDAFGIKPGDIGEANGMLVVRSPVDPDTLARFRRSWEELVRQEMRGHAFPIPAAPLRRPKGGPRAGHRQGASTVSLAQLRRMLKRRS